ncbi:hypothetical protein SCACP_31760 [Sporomusa carbonis]|uniref:hypothetical protein n=1 Tax=Sporomusa carbonis TaxID=3076075 RepID=UPI003A73AF6A
MTQSLPAPARIAAIVPRYSACGDSTVIFSNDGNATILKSRIRAVIRRLAQCGAVDLAALKTKTRAATQRAILEPLPLAPGLILVPVKVRQPRVAGDVTTGYVNFHAVTTVCSNKNKPYQATVQLAGKTEIPVLWTAATVNRQLTLARLAATAAPAIQPVTAGAFRESFPGYEPELLTLAAKLVDIFNDILSMKLRQ